MIRYDNSIVDSKPWGLGVMDPACIDRRYSGAPGTSTATEMELPTPSRKTVKVGPFIIRLGVAGGGSGDGAADGSGPSGGGGAESSSAGLSRHRAERYWVVPTSPAAADLELLEGRHPLALAHFANHPGKGETVLRA